MKNRERIYELLLVLSLVIFVIALTASSQVSDKTAQQVFDKLSQALPSAEESDLKTADNQAIKKQLGLSPSDYDSVVYYYSDSVMQVRELLVLRLADSSQEQPTMQKLSERLEEKRQLFEGYAPEESALLQKAVLECKKGFIIYAVCDEPSLLKSLMGSAF